MVVCIACMVGVGFACKMTWLDPATTAIIESALVAAAFGAHQAQTSSLKAQVRYLKLRGK
jgi:hypothetical protein